MLLLHKILHLAREETGSDHYEDCGLYCVLVAPHTHTAVLQGEGERRIQNIGLKSSVIFRARLMSLCLE